jgi:hypothetical protein
MSGGSKHCEPVRRALEKSIGSHLISAGRVCHGNADLRESLPQVPFLGRPGLPTCLQYLVG